MVSLFSLIPTKSAESTANTTGNKIQVALLLDTSNSMDGLIEQAKSRLWNIINTLTTLKYDGKEPQIEIALYEYGNDGLSRANDFIRQVAPLTTDLDLISEKLFALRTNGGSEYCGAVIQNAVKSLKWNFFLVDGRSIQSFLACHRVLFFCFTHNCSDFSNTPVVSFSLPT